MLLRLPPPADNAPRVKVLHFIPQGFDYAWHWRYMALEDDEYPAAMWFQGQHTGRPY